MDPLLARILDAAGRAPSAHNTQPWLLRWRGDFLEININENRTLPAVDRSGADLLHALGALLENVVLTLEQQGLEPSYEVTESLLAKGPTLTLGWKPTSRPPPDPTLYRMIPIRQTSRLPYSLESLSLEDLDALQASVPGSRLVILTDRGAIDDIRRLVAEATGEQLADDPTARELYDWLRFSRADRRWWRDGLNAECMGWKGLESFALRALLAPGVLRRFGPWGLYRMLAADIEKNAPATPAVGLLTVETDGVAPRIEAGRHLQRTWLLAASRGLSTHPISAAVDIRRTRLRVLERFGLPPDTLHVNLFRIGKSATTPARSPRLPSDEILAQGS
jgi:nitroreductase